MNGFSKAVLASMLRDAEDTRETVRQWLLEEQDPRARLEGFARQLDHDFCAQYQVEDVWPAELEERLIAEALAHVDYRAVARALLKRFGPRPAWAPPSLTPSAN